MYIFKNLDDACTRLGDHAKNFKLPLEAKLGSPSQIINYSVTQNIFRALSIKNHSPSVLYREWAMAAYNKLHIHLKACQKQDAYDEIIASTTAYFMQNWKAMSNEKLGYGPASKIVNLLIKTTQESKDYRINSIIPFQHVPWDSYTLRPLRHILNELTDLDYRISIPTSASMSFVNTPELYQILQKCLIKLYGLSEIKAAPIYFDYFAWNDNH